MIRGARSVPGPATAEVLVTGYAVATGRVLVVAALVAGVLVTAGKPADRRS